ncbi:MAG TPA: hypothetical protein VGF99_12210 [Myxococcota bacterium]
MNHLRALFVVVCIALTSSSAAAQVAVALQLPDANATHRDLATGVVGVVAPHWQLLEPALSATDTAPCAAEPSCLRGLAAKARATHLLVVAVAGVGVRDAAVSVQLYDASGRVLFDDTSVVVVSDDPHHDSVAIGERLLAASSSAAVPSRTPRPLQVSTPADRGLTGAGLVGLGVVVGAGSWFGANALLTSQPQSATVAGITGLSAGVVVAAIGAGLVVFDAGHHDP